MECAEGVVVAERYRLVRKLGAGGMGSVWLSHDIALDSNCALKLIDEEKSQSEEVRLRFEREAKAAAQLRGAHVVDVFDHGEWGKILYIAMEYLEGEDLGARLDRDGALEPAAAYRIVAHIARALTRAHAYGIVHRDLKPENVFLVSGDEGEVAKVLDFGIAKHDAYSLQGKATRTGSFLGTPYYVSPEQARGKSTDHRSDLWSLGIIAFQCLTGRPPFESDALGELMGLILYEDLPRPTLRNPNLPPTLDAWWERAAARDRELRFQTAKELSDSLAVALSLDKIVSVQSVAPRRPNYADGSGPFPASSFPPGPVEDHFARRYDSLGESHTAPTDLSLLEEQLETDAPVSRTRHPALRVWQALRWAERLPMRLSGLTEGRKRTLVAAAVGGGIALGALVTLALIGGDDTESSQAPEDLRPVRTIQAQAAASANAAGLGTLSAKQAAGAARPPLPDGVVTGAAAPQPASSGVAPEPSVEPKKRRVVPRRPKRPDYGI